MHKFAPLKSFARQVALQVLLRGDRLGLHVHPKRYYSSVPDYTWLRNHPELWQKRASLVGVTWDLDTQLPWLEDICRDHYSEVVGFNRLRALEAGGYGQGFGPIEAQVLHCFVRSHQPPRVVEVGGGVTTAIIADAGHMNASEGGTLPAVVSVEPFPRPALVDLEGVTVVRERVQAVPETLFATLAAGDLLFIDSTHTVKAGSDVLRLYLDVIPALPSGVFVHAHDITLPYLFGREFARDLYDWQESSLLLALLTHNPRLEVLCSLSALHYDRREELRHIAPDYEPQHDENGLRAPGGLHFPASIWLRTR